MQTGLIYVHALAAGLLIGKITLLSFVIAPILAAQLDAPTFGRVVRRMFPAYYAMGIMTACLGLAALAGLVVIRGPMVGVLGAAGLWLIVLISEWYCRSSLTPHSNRMRDELKNQEQSGTVDPTLQAAWERLHKLSLLFNTLVLVLGLFVLALITVFTAQGGMS